jgi:four helix bundle protein
MGQGYRDLQVWHRSMDLAASVYGLSKTFPREDLYGITSQIRRSSLSVPSNIAEGTGRKSAGEFKQFLAIARGSNYEVQTQLELAKKLKLANQPRIEAALGLSQEVGKMIFALIESL